MALRLALIAALLLTVLPGCKHRATTMPARAPVAAVYAHPTPPPPRSPGLFSWLPAYPTAARAAGGERYPLDSGDKLRIVIFGEEHLTRSYTVDGSGHISMPLIGAVAARGLTTFELENRIAAQLKEKYVKDPKVTIEVEIYRPFFILGEVRRPGQYPYVTGMTVETAVAIAGGYTERAKERKVELTQRVNGRSMTVLVPPVHPVRPGDTIKVMERFF